MEKRYSNLAKARLLLRQILPRKGLFGQIFFTVKCNLRCDYCKVVERKTKDISLEEWKKIIAKMASWGVTYISITGGESVIRKDLEDLVSYLKQLYIFSKLNSNGMLLTEERIESLAQAGLCSLAISLDSLGDGKKIKNDSARVFELLSYAKERGIIAEARAVMNPSDPLKTLALAEKTVGRGFFFGFGTLQAVGGLFSKPLRQSPVIGGMAQDRHGIWLPAHLFQVTDYSGKWKCDPQRDRWITVGNDGTLMACQEWGSNIPILEIKNLEDPRWRTHKSEAVAQCPGCYYDCYFSQEAARKHLFATLKAESRSLRAAWPMLN